MFAAGDHRARCDRRQPPRRRRGGGARRALPGARRRRPAGSGSKDIAGRARAGRPTRIAELLPYARAAGVPLAMEPLHPMTCADRACITTTAQALDAGDGRSAIPCVGVALDVYHIWWDPDAGGADRRAAGRIGAFHVCDWLVPTSDMLFDRGMMGDGVIDIPRIRALVEQCGLRRPDQRRDSVQRLVGARSRRRSAHRQGAFRCRRLNASADAVELRPAAAR